MQPDPFVFLQSVRRELELAADELSGKAREGYLRRAAQVVERLAFHEQGLDALLAGAVRRQESLLERLRSLSPSPNLPSSFEDATLLARYERNAREIDALLLKLGAAAQGRDDEFSSAVDALVSAVSEFAHDLTRDIAEHARTSAERWQSKRTKTNAIPVTAERLTGYLQSRYPEHPRLRVAAVEKLVGLNANEAFFIDIEGHPTWPQRLILRRSLPAQIQPTSITEEFAVVSALWGRNIPIPQPVFCEDDSKVLGQPFVAMARLSGEVQPLSRMGAHGKRIYLQLAALLGRLHSLSPTILPPFRRAQGNDALGWLHRRIDVYEQEWRRSAREPVHTVTAGFYWLRRHAAEFIDRQVIVHGDLDQRNTLVEGEEICALIDWEVTHQGHPAEDLAYVREQVEEVMPWTEFVAAYEANGGAHVTPEKLRYGAVLSNLLRVTTSMVAHVAYVDGTIDNFLMGTVRTLETEAACQRLHTLIHN
ncbi:MAG: phosphotransferase family protein [Steroidobacteraceae bacterium]